MKRPFQVFAIVILLSIILLTVSSISQTTTNPGASTTNTDNVKQTIVIPKDQEAKIKTDNTGKVISADLIINSEEQSRIVLGGKEFYAPKGSRIVIESTDPKTIKVTVPKASTIKFEPKTNNSADDKIVRYLISQSKDSKVEDATLPSGNKFKGVLEHDGKNFYVTKDNEATIDNIKVKNIASLAKNVNEKVNVYFKEGKFEGNYVFFGDKRFETGSMNDKDGNSVELLSGNKYIKVDNKQHLSLVPFAKSKIMIANGKVSQIGGGVMDQDYTSYMISSDKGELLYKKGLGIPGFIAKDYEGKLNVPLEYLPFKADGKPVSPYTQKIIFDEKSAKIMQMTADESRVRINPDEKIPVNPQPESQLPIETQERPDFSKYAGQQTTARTKNFYVISASGNANMYAAALEYYRNKNAIDWLGKPLPDWTTPLTVTIQENNNILESGGQTGLIFQPGRPGAKMDITGKPENLLYSTIPHEVQHLISAEKFGGPLPRFIDEGIATSSETAQDQLKHQSMLNQFLQQGRWYQLDQLTQMKEYPQDFMPLYAQGNSITNYLIKQGGGGQQGRIKLYEAVGFAQKNGWNAAMNKYYGANGLSDLQQKWLASIGKVANMIAVFAKLMIIVFIIKFTKIEKRIEI